MKVFPVAKRAARKAVKKPDEREKFSRNIQIPAKSGRIVPLILIFADISALGSLPEGASVIVNAVDNLKPAKEKLAEDQ